MSKSKISPKTQKLLLGLVLLAVVAVIVFFFPEFLPAGDDVFTTVPADSTAASPTTPASTTKAAEATTASETERKLDRNGSYTSRDDVALYIHQYGKLPKKSGRTYTECDIDTRGASARGAKRIVFSNDGLIYYTNDHYNTFTLLYGNEN